MRDLSELWRGTGEFNRWSGWWKTGPAPRERAVDGTSRHVCFCLFCSLCSDDPPPKVNRDHFSTGPKRLHGYKSYSKVNNDGEMAICGKIAQFIRITDIGYKHVYPMICRVRRETEVERRKPRVSLTSSPLPGGSGVQLINGEYWDEKVLRGRSTTSPFPTITLTIDLAASHRYKPSFPSVTH